MAEYKTKYAIGDLVYVATAREVDRKIVKAVNISGLKEEVTYEFDKDSVGGYGFMMGYFDATPRRYKASELYEDRESAVAMHESLKAKKEAEDIKDAAEHKKQRRRDLEQQLRELDEE